MPIQDHQIEERLASAGVRYTGGRRAVVKALGSADGPRSAAELHREMHSDVPLSSIYRTLSVLEGEGVVEPHHGKKGLTRFELAEWLTGHHHHLVCIQCGAVEDVELPSGSEEQLEDVVSAITEHARFAPVGHALEVDGRCRRCR
jgi:Fur family transcriptional regulator, ferric uptake regulator